MELIHGSLHRTDQHLPQVCLRIDRQTLAKRRWRGRAADGQDFGFDLERPLQHEAVFFQSAAAVYLISQTPEPLLSVPISSAPQAATISWQIGNLHFPVAVQEDCLLVEDDIAIRQMFQREQITFDPVSAVFQPLGIASAPHHHAGSPGHHHEHDHT